MSKNIDNTAAFLGTVAAGSALRKPLSNTSNGLQRNMASNDLLNVFSHIRSFWVSLVVWIAGSKGAYELMSWAHVNDSGWIMALGVLMAFIFWVGMTLYVLQEYCWFVRAKMLTRVFPIFSTPWKMLTQCHGYSGKTAYYFSTILMVVYPVTFGPMLLLWDALRFLRFIVSFVITGGKVRFGGTAFVWYKKQAKHYNAMKKAHGTEIADQHLRLSTYGIDVPVLKAGLITEAAWGQQYKDEIFGQKIAKYGNLFK